MNINTNFSQNIKLMNSSQVDTFSFYTGNHSTNSTTTLGSLLQDYSLMKTSGYRSLVNSYYNKTTNTTINSIYGDLNSTQSINNEDYTTLRDTAGDLYTSSMSLASNGSKSLFKTDSEGNYDRKKITEAINEFANNYNKTITAASDVTNTKASQTASYMINGTKSFESSLNKIGITIGKDNKLTVNKEALEKASISSIKSVFNGSSSYAANTATKAVSLSNTSSLQLTYNQSGNASYYYANLYAMKF